MIYPFSLQATGIVVGLLLIALHAFALARPAAVQPLLRAFPRSRVAGTILLVVVTVWSFWLIATIDLGEFARMRQALLVAIPIGAVLTWIFVDEFLAVRMLGALALLGANCLLDPAYLRPETSRLVLVVLAYAWIFAGLFLVGMPYILRDGFAWLLGSAARYRNGAILGCAYGVIVLGCALVLW